jgi:hypothetical protein
MGLGANSVGNCGACDRSSLRLSLVCSAERKITGWLGVMVGAAVEVFDVVGVEVVGVATGGDVGEANTHSPLGDHWAKPAAKRPPVGSGPVDGRLVPTALEAEVRISGEATERITGSVGQAFAAGP